MIDGGLVSVINKIIAHETDLHVLVLTFAYSCYDDLFLPVLFLYIGRYSNQYIN